MDKLTINGQVYRGKETEDLLHYGAIMWTDSIECCNAKRVWTTYMYVYVCDYLMYIIRLCYFPLIHKSCFCFQYYMCLYLFIYSSYSVQALPILFIQLLSYTIYHIHMLLIPRILTWLKSVLFIIIWFLLQLNFSLDLHAKCLTE